MEVLYVDACVRGEASRTRQLAEAFLQTLTEKCHGLTVTRHCLPEMGLQPLTREALIAREAICDACDWHAPAVQPAEAFRRAGLVLIAAPYWDLSFPSCLKVWTEHMWVRNLTFFYRNDQPVGLCCGKHAVYITTSGSPIGAYDFGTDYMHAVLRTLGISGFTRISAEALDLDASDPQRILAQAEQDARREAERLACLL